MISTKTIKVIRCDVPGCTQAFVVETDRDTLIREDAKVKGWARRKGFITMEDRCPKHVNWKAGE